MLGGLWLIITGSLLVASLIFHQVLLLMVALLFFLAGVVARLWDRYCLSRVEYSRHLSSQRVFFGEKIELAVEVINRKPLPLPWLQIDDELPAEVILLKGKTSPSHLPSNMVLNNLFSLSWYHKIKRRYPVQCLQRGYFTFGPARIRSGDLLGFFTREKDLNATDHLIVYPKIVPLEKLLVPSNEPIGNISTRSYLFQDPLLTLGVREYHFGDSLKRIHWKNTARLGELQTKVFEPTTVMDMGVFLDVRTVKPPYWGIVSELLELAIITATSVAHYALSKGYRVGLYVNQYQQASNELIRLAPSQHPGQFRQILETLAPLRGVEAIPIDRLVVNENRNLPWGSSLVLITAAPTEDLIATLFRMKRAGRKIALIVVGGAQPEFSHQGFAIYYVSDKVPWQEIETLDILPV